ncbi:MAG: FG-GAP-like repeat-containing protein, partial [Myxococcota bacterium]
LDFLAQVPRRGLRARFDAGGARIAVHDDDVGVRVLGVGRPGGIAPFAAVPALGACVPGMADPTGACVQRLEYADGGVTEWWVARADGFEQGWTVDVAPDGAGPLEVHVAISDADTRIGDGEVWLDGDLGAQLVVSGLAAWDADGRPLDARFAALDGGFRVVVDDTDARYPIEIDPIYATASWSVEGAVGSEPFGTSLAGVGDLNGDGYDDVVGGAPGALGGSGAAYVYLGSAAGLSSTAAVVLRAGSGELADDFGFSLAGAGDVNADGYDDILVGAYGSLSGAYVFHGAADGPSETPTTYFTAPRSEDYGYAVDGLGDVNGDGYDDVAIGSPEYSSDTGRVYVHHGGPTGISTTAARTLTGSGSSSGQNFGKALAGAGDVNGDGYDDLVVGAPRYSSSRGAVYVFHGSASGIAATASASLYGDATGDAFGSAVDGAGDVDGDGHHEIIVGAYLAGSYGKAYVYAGSRSGITTGGVSTLTAYGEVYGHTVAGVGDVDGDGFADVAVGDRGYSSLRGQAYVYRGSLGGLYTSPFVTLTGSGAEWLGNDIAGAGDVDGDGYDDVLIGAEYADGGLGVAYVYEGSASTITRTTALTGLSDDALGYAVASAGDVNADGYDDVVVGAYGYDDATGRAYVYQGSAAGLSTTAATTITGTTASAYLGHAVAGGCDVNADGYDDVIVGAYGASWGAVYVHHGSATGTPSTPTTALTGSSDAGYLGSGVACADLNGDGYDDIVATAPYSNAFRTWHGRSTGVASSTARTISLLYARTVARLGDVNGDGYEDVAIGAETYSSYTGQVSVYTGSAAGLTSTAVTTLTGYNTGDYFGHALTGADVNGDAYDDLIVGAYGYNGGRGRAYVYHGAAGGFSSTLRAVISGGAENDYLGVGLAGLGDLDADGYDEVAIAAHGVGSTGAVYVHHGSGSGLGSTAGSTLSTLATTLAFGGDVDGDGGVEILTGYADHDTGAGIVSLFGTYADADEDGVATGLDCDDTDASVGGPDTAYADADRDGFGDPAAPAPVCAATAGYVADATDCDDTSAAVHPGGTEVCDAADADEDCDGAAEDADASVTGRGLAYV